jgi:peptide/nickel transport system substrate-binding protein
MGEYMTIIDETTNEVAKTGVSRRHFIQGAAATAAGAALPVAGIVGAGSASAAGKTLRVATGKQVHPAAPWETSDGSLFILSQVGEWLCFQKQDGSLEPRLATSWKSSNGAKTWTFKIRKGVKFNDGTPLTVDDIVYTYKSVFTANPSRSKGNFTGIIDANGIVKVDNETLRFDLLAASGNFPYTVSSVSYGMCVIKNGANGGAAWTKDMISAGPWKMESYKEFEKTVFVKNPFYWDTTFKPGIDKLELIQYTSAATALPALKTGGLDAVAAMEAADALSLDKNKFNILTTKAGAGFAHVHLRCNFGPFKDKRVRQAAALTIDRAGYVKGVMKTIGGVVGNDSVMDPYPAADKSVPQRKQDIAKAKQLMKEAGVPNGFSVDLSTWARDDINKYANLIKNSFAKIGIKVTLKIDGSNGGGAVYYTYNPYPSAKGTVFSYDNNSWLASNIGITDWAGRGVPDQYLTREWKSTADWSGAQLWDDVLDAAIDEYIAAPNPAKQKIASKKIQERSLEMTPYILAYTSNLIYCARKGVSGFSVNGMGQIIAKDVKIA